MVHPHSPYRIFAFSTVSTLAILAWVFGSLGPSALLVTATLVIIETAFSFDNAIINAKILTRLSKFWQNMFLTVGILIAVFGMRIIFPVILVMITAGLSWGEVVNLAFNNPEAYSHELELAMPTISAFGGAFLLMLSLHFFLDDSREVHWLARIERPVQKLAGKYSAILIAALVVAIFALLPMNDHPWTTVEAGALGILTYTILHGITVMIERKQKLPKGTSPVALTGWAAFSTFIYLEFLDASFSFDGVLGAFAITSQVALIAAGLGIGALWVRSLTVFMVRRGTLSQYKYLDHGAHYTVGVLSLILFSSAFGHLPELLTGALGLSFIIASIIASVKARKVIKA